MRVSCGAGPRPVRGINDANGRRRRADRRAARSPSSSYGRLGLIDALIAASAIGLSVELCTFNTKHYRVIEGLTIVKPYVR